MSAIGQRQYVDGAARTISGGAGTATRLLAAPCAERRRLRATCATSPTTVEGSVDRTTTLLDDTATQRPGSGGVSSDRLLNGSSPGSCEVKEMIAGDGVEPKVARVGTGACQSEGSSSTCIGSATSTSSGRSLVALCSTTCARTKAASIRLILSLSRTMRTSGVLCSVLPPSRMCVSCRKWSGRPSDAHYAMFDETALRWYLERAGLTVQSMKSNDHPNLLVWARKPTRRT